MNEKPLVSILIPSYNHSKYIEKTLDSIIQDSYENKEIVIIDDGSKDNSVDVIKNWITEHSNLIEINFITRKNLGINKTLNQLKSLAKGKYFLIIASDDYLINDSISKRVEILLNNPGKMVVFGDAHVVDSNNNIIAESSIEEFHHGCKRNLLTDKGILNAALFNPVFSGALDIIDKDIYNYIGEYPDNVKIEDCFFWQAVAIQKKAIFVNEYVSCYRRHDSNITKDGELDIDILKGIYITCKKNIKYLNPGLTKVKFKIFVFKLFLRCFKHGVKFDKKN